MAEFSEIGRVLDDCDWCNSKNVALTKYKKEWLCNHCLSRRKLVKPSKQQRAREDKEKDRFRELTAL